MLDTHGRKFVQPILDKTANMLIKLGVSANTATLMAFGAGLGAAALLAAGQTVAAVGVLWFSGLLDAVDGTIARKTGSTSPLGTLMDVVFDRLVEIGILLALIFADIALAVPVAVVLSSIIVSMTVFLTVGAAAQNSGQKTFYYQAGIAERTEGFIMLSLAILIHPHRAVVLYIFAAMIIFTAGQRFAEGVRMFRDKT